MEEKRRRTEKGHEREKEEAGAVRRDASPGMVIAGDGVTRGNVSTVSGVCSCGIHPKEVRYDSMAIGCVLRIAGDGRGDRRSGGCAAE